MKRLIFTLYHDGTSFCLSRNFNLQHVGNSQWLKNNYGFSNTSSAIDELFILNVNRKETSTQLDFFLSEVRSLTSDVFVPITIGGQIRDINRASLYFKNGADKVLLNSSCHYDKELMRSICRHYGRQSLVSGFDCKKASASFDYNVYANNGEKLICPIKQINFASVQELCGEILFQSIDNDGNGSGYDMNLVSVIKELELDNPVILTGGAGKPEHFVELCSSYPMVSGISTGNLFNFLGGALFKVRQNLIDLGNDFPSFNHSQIY